MDVLLVDDHPIIHEVMREVVRRAIPGANFHAEAGLPAGIEHGRTLPDLRIALIDLGLPGYAGIEALSGFRKVFPRVATVVISANDDRDCVRKAIAAGAAGYIPKTSRPDVTVAALQLVVSGGIYLPPEGTARSAVARAGHYATSSNANLTGRQSEVTRLLAKGMSYREIGLRLRIAEATVKQHAHAAYRTLGVSSRVQAVITLSRRAPRSG